MTRLLYCQFLCSRFPGWFFFYSGQMGYRFFTFLNGVDAGRESIPSKVTLVCYILCCFFSPAFNSAGRNGPAKFNQHLVPLYLCVSRRFPPFDFRPFHRERSITIHSEEKRWAFLRVGFGDGSFASLSFSFRLFFILFWSI